MSCQYATNQSNIVSKSSTAQQLSSIVAPAKLYDPYVFTESNFTTLPIYTNPQSSRGRIVDVNLINSSNNFQLTQLNNSDNSKGSNILLEPSPNITRSDVAAQQIENSNALYQKINVKKRTTVRPADNNGTGRQHKKLKRSEPLKHTPSLWETPLLLNTEPVRNTKPNVVLDTTSTFQNNKIPALYYTPKISTISSEINANSTNEPIKTATMVSAALPPSNFHQTNLVQHWQTVNQNKKSTKAESTDIVQHSVQSDQSWNRRSNLPVPPLRSLLSPNATILKNVVTTKEHQFLESDFNEIRVNVIYRNPLQMQTQKQDESTTFINKAPKQAPFRNAAGITMTSSNSHARIPDPIPLLNKPDLDISSQLAFVPKQNNHALKECNSQKGDSANLNRTPIKKTTMNSLTERNKKSRTTIEKLRNNINKSEKTEQDLQDISPSTVKGIEAYKHNFWDASKEESTTSYCLQNWINISVLPPPMDTYSWREERIALHKNQLRRKTFQMIHTHSLQKLILAEVNSDLVTINKFLQKQSQNRYAKIHNVANKRKLETSDNTSLKLAPYCDANIKHKTDQQLLPIVNYNQNKLLTTTDVSKCFEKTNPLIHDEFISQHRTQLKKTVTSKQVIKKQLTAPKSQGRKTKLQHTGNITTRPKKRSKFPDSEFALNETEKISLTHSVSAGSAVLHRKSSTTSLESIASNSYSSSGLNASTALTPFNRYIPADNTVTILKPAQIDIPSITNNFVNNGVFGNYMNRLTASSNAINQTGLASYNSSDIPSNRYMNNSDTANLNYINNTITSLSNLNSEAEELQYSQDLLSTCDNSSIYASSEDTGLGGLSEAEFMISTDNIPFLGDHDFIKVLNCLPANAFNEIYESTVHDAEREEMEHALEMADKQIRTLQQSMESDSFLGDIDGSNEMAIMSSSNTCDINATESFFFENSSGYGNSLLPSGAGHDNFIPSENGPV